MLYCLLFVVLQLLQCQDTLGLNLEVRNALTVNLRQEKSPGKIQAPAFAGYAFDMRKDNGVSSLVFGQPRSGVLGKGESPGGVYHCNLRENNSLKSGISTAIENCSTVNVFDQVNRQQRGDDHNNTADALGLTIARAGKGDEYIACSPGRQRRCPDKLPYATGACYAGSPNDANWEFMKWNETECFSDTITITFVVDGSRSVTEKNFLLVKDWLINVTESLIEIFGESVRTTVMQYSSNDRDFTIPYTLNDGLSIEEIKAKIRDMPYHNGGSTYTELALKQALKNALTLPNAKKVIIVLTDGHASDKIDLSVWNKENKDKATFFAVGVANYDRKELVYIAGENIETVETFDTLNTIIGNLTSGINSAVELEATDTSAESGNPQIGMSIAHSEIEKLFLIGGPSSNAGSGTIMYFTENLLSLGYVSNTQLEDFFPNRKIKDSYFGYSVVTGVFDGDNSSDYVAVGAPRYNFAGAVVLWKLPGNDMQNKDHIFIPVPEEMRQVGCYFGGVLLTLDVNKDGKDDLLVGAPLFVGDNYDEGRVFVYISQPNKSFNAWADASYKPITLFGDNESHGRFGSAMASAGDLNFDGYKDFVVGAPLVNDGKGAIYIYHGAKDGIVSKLAQKISASTMSGAQLEYFGQSLQGDVDIDGNEYPDIIVGSPKSDSITVLKSRPIAAIRGTLKFTKSLIDLYECFQKDYTDCARLEICFHAQGKALEPLIGIQYNLTLDAVKTARGDKRLFLDDKNFVSEEIWINSTEVTCLIKELSVKPDPNTFDNIVAELEFELSTSHQETILSSIRRPNIPNTDMSTIGFIHYCRNHSCLPNIEVELRPMPAILVKSGSENLDLTQSGTLLIITQATENQVQNVRVNLSNSGETTFRPKLKVSHLSDLSLSSVATVSAKPRANTCIGAIGDPVTIGNQSVQSFEYTYASGIMRRDSWCYFEFNITADILKNEATLQELQIKITRYSSSGSDSNLTSNDTWYGSRKIRYMSDFSLTRRSSDVEMTFPKESVSKNISSVKEIGEDRPDTVQEFMITGTGYSNIPHSTITFSWPWKTTEQNPILYLHKLECKTQAENSKCQCDNTKVNPFNLATDSTNPNKTNVGKATIHPAEIPIEMENMNCSDTYEASHTCESLTCSIRNLQNADKVHFSAHFRLWHESIMFNSTNFTSVDIKSHIEVSTVGSPLFISNKGENIMIKYEEAVITGKKFVEILVREQQETTWYIFLGAGIGLFIVIIIAVLMWKYGFFESSHARKLRELQQKEGEIPDNEQEMDNSGMPEYSENASLRSNVFEDEQSQD